MNNLYPNLWDAEVESPATLAILGAGPIGIEAALYARFLGYFVEIFDTRKVASRSLRWGRQSMQVPFADCSTSLGRAALIAQYENFDMPAMEQVLCGEEFAERYLIPLAKTDLLFESIHIQSRVESISRYRSFRNDLVPLQDRCNDEFCLTIDSRARGVWRARADVVLDCTGLAVESLGMGAGGGYCVGQQIHSHEIQYQIPRLSGLDRAAYAGKHSVLWGDSLEALATAESFLELSKYNPDTRLSWITPIRDENDWSLERKRRVQTLAARLEKQLKQFGCFEIYGMEQIDRPSDQSWDLILLMEDHNQVKLECDKLISLPEPQADWQWTSSLRVHDVRYLHAQVEQNQHDWAEEAFPGWRLATAEPHYYCLGSKRSPDRQVNWTTYHLQIRDLFAILGDRRDLDLYEHFRRQVDEIES